MVSPAEFIRVTAENEALKVEIVELKAKILELTINAKPQQEPDRDTSVPGE